MMNQRDWKRPIHTACFLACANLAFTASAQPRLEDMHIESAGADTHRLTFTDPGTGATGYEIEYSFDLETGSWIVPDASLTDLGDGRWQADLDGLNPTQGFVRVKLLGIGGSAIAYIDTDAIAAALEGGTARITVRFTEPYFGSLRYRWSGTAGVETPTGIIQVDGSTATIELRLLDNPVVNELTYLSLSLETAGDTGYQLDENAGASLVTLEITDNDSLWDGSMSGAGAEIGFSIEMLTSDGSLSMNLKGDSTSLIGTSDSLVMAETATATPDTFHALFTDIPMPDGDATANLELTADSTSEPLIQGSATLTIQPTGEHLVTIIEGPFTLVRRTAAQPTTSVSFLQ